MQDLCGRRWRVPDERPEQATDLWNGERQEGDRPPHAPDLFRCARPPFWAGWAWAARWRTTAR